MHRLLKSQLRKIGYTGEAISREQLDHLLSLVDDAYRDSDEDREFLEHTLEVSSQEMQSLYAELKERSETQLAISKAKYEKLATHDMLTGIFNRFGFDQQLQAIISFAKRHKHLRHLEPSVYLIGDHRPDPGTRPLCSYGKAG